MQVNKLLLGASKSEPASEAVQGMLWLCLPWQPSSLQMQISAALLVERCPREPSPRMEVSICLPVGVQGTVLFQKRCLRRALGDSQKRDREQGIQEGACSYFRIAKNSREESAFLERSMNE